MANRTPKAGCRFANSDARDGPDAGDRREPEDVRQEERPDDREGEARATSSAPKWKLWLVVCGIPTAAIGIQPSASTSALIRNGEYRRISGAIATEYIAHVSAVDDRERVAETCAREPAGARRDEADADERDGGGEPEAAAHAARARRRRDEADEDRRRAEDQRHGRGRGLVDRVDEADLVHEDHRRGDRDERRSRRGDPERALARPGEEPEERRRRRVADRRVRERLEAVREHVPRDGRR